MTDGATRRRRFAQFLPGGSAHAPGPAHAAFCTGLLGLLLEGEPARVMELLARQPRTLRRFFRGSPHRAAAWFGHFSMAGAHEFRHGARALANYAMAQRDRVWHLLEWRGRHSQAPVAVAQRMHYFCELDVGRTVANLERCVRAAGGRRSTAAVAAAHASPAPVRRIHWGLHLSIQ